MPVRCDISPANRIAIGVASGPVTLRDLEGFLDTLEQNNAITYPKIFDATFGISTLSDADWLTLAIRLSEYTGPRTLGALAVVAATGGDDTFARELAALKSGTRQAKVFRSIHEARSWIRTAMPAGL